MAVALVMGNMIGSGVFLLPASLAPFGWDAVSGWIVTIAGAMCLAWMFARLMAGSPIGPAELVQEEFGPVPGFLIGFSLWVYVWAGMVTISMAVVSYGSSFLPALGAHPALSALAIIWAMTGLNLMGTRVAGGFQLITTILKLVPLLVVAGLIVLILVDPARAPVADLPAFTLSLSGTNQAAALALWAMLGFESACLAAGRVEDPQRTIPRATLIGAGATGVFYLIVCSGIALLLPANQVAASNAPFELFVASYWSAGPAALVGLFAAISALGAVNGWILVQGEVPTGMAQRGMMPRLFARLAPNGMPVAAQLISTTLASILIWSNSSKSMGGLFSYTALLTTSVVLWLYFACALVALKRGVARITAALGIVFCLWSLWGAGWSISLSSVLLMAAGLPLYWWAKREAQA